MALIIDSLLFPIFYLVCLSIILLDSLVYANLFIVIGTIMLISKIVRLFIDRKLVKWFDESMKWRKLVASQVED